MQLEAALGQRFIGQDEEMRRAIRKFLYKTDNLDTNTLSADARLVLDNPALQGGGFKLLDSGQNNIAFGNGETVFKLSSNAFHFDRRTASDADIPEEFAAKRFDSGKCNGVKYGIYEQLDTSKPATFKEIIPFLFKLHAAGFGYDDAQYKNFGRGQNGKIKILDLEHLHKSGRFKHDLGNAIGLSREDKFPMVTSDENNTYIIYAEKYPVDAKRVKAMLESVGISKDTVEIMGTVPLVRIKQTELRCGSPPVMERLEDFLASKLAATVTDYAARNNAALFVRNLTLLLHNSGGIAAQMASSLPDSQVLAAWSKQEFSDYYAGILKHLDAARKIDKTLGATFDRIEERCDLYFKQRYPIQNIGR